MSQQDPLPVFAPDLFEATTALVTGGGRGIGRATALAFARLGADVVIASRNALALFLCSPAGRYINGRALVMDGGHMPGHWTDMWDPETL